jgi:hypothetical protein
MKDCIEIWQKATIREALPDEYKDKKMQELSRAGNEAKYGQATEFDTDENRDMPRDKNLAAEGSFGPIEDVSEDFSKMNRGQDVVTESERAKRLEQRLNEAEEERMIPRREVDGL